LLSGNIVSSATLYPYKSTLCTSAPAATTLEYVKTFSLRLSGAIQQQRRLPNHTAARSEPGLDEIEEAGPRAMSLYELDEVVVDHTMSQAQ
jgi:hypothetical protein